MDRIAHGEPAPPDTPRLARPLDPVTGRPSHSTRMDRPKLGAAPLNPAPVMPAWDRGRSSVPAVTHSPQEGLAAPFPLPPPPRGFPLGDPVGAAPRAGATAEQDGAGAAIPGG